ncbi:MAG: tetratricopeptide repeat protein [Rhizomicrobium sp.]
MDRDLNAFSNADAWRVAALSVMGERELHTLFSSGDATPWVIAAANGGLAEAQTRLGRMLLSAEGMTKDEIAAFHWFRRAAASGNAEAHNMLGRCLENGWGIARDPVEAARHYALAAQAGNAWAQYNLGHLYLDGVGIGRDPAIAFGWYSRAAAQGHARAMNLIGRCHEEGWGTRQDAALARPSYRKSAEGGYFRGAYNYATILVKDGCFMGAAIWFRKALATATEPTRSTMLATLASSPHLKLPGFANKSH